MALSRNIYSLFRLIAMNEDVFALKSIDQRNCVLLKSTACFIDKGAGQTHRFNR
jgi:hypothetical protein